MRLPINLTGLQVPWGPNRRVGCLRSSLECMARTHGRFTRRHEPRPGDAPCGGCTATEAYQRVAPLIWRVSTSAVGPPNRRMGCLISSLKRVAWTYDRYAHCHEPHPQTAREA